MINSQYELKKRRIGCERGFTLIELMVVIGILAVVWAVSPNYSEVVTSYRTTSVTNSLAGSLKRARGEAMRFRVPVIICASTDRLTCNAAIWNTGWIAFPDVNNDGLHANNGSEPIVSSSVAISNFSITGNNIAGSITYLPSGLVAGFGAGGGRFDVCESSNQYQGRAITLNAIGKPTIAPRSCP